MIVRINKRDITIGLMAVLSFVSTLSTIRYLRMTIPIINMVSLVSMALAFVPAALNAFNNKKNISIIYVVFIMLWLALFISTIYHRNSISTYITQIGPCLLVLLIVASIRNENELLLLLSIWQRLSLILLIIDLASMIMYPNGLYKGDNAYYDINWFLGFKTERLYYVIPLVVFSTFIVLKEKHKIDFELILICSLSIIATLWSQATGGAISIFLLLACIPFMESFVERRKNIFSKILTGIIRLFSNFYSFITAYIFIFVTIVLFQNNSRLISLVASITGKSMTFSNRLPLWTFTIQHLNNHLLVGEGMLSTQQYQIITRGYNNPHNVILSYLLNGGIIGLLIVFLCIYISFSSKKKKPLKIVFILGIVVYLVLGISSSALAYCPFFFCLMYLCVYDSKSVSELTESVQGNEI